MAWGAIAAAAIQIGMQLYQGLSSNNSAKSLAKLSAENTKLQVNNVIRNFSQQANTNNARYAQEQEAMYQEAQQIYLQNLQSQATAQTSSTGAGVVGTTIDNLFRGYDRASAISNFLSERNLRNLGLQYDDNYEALRVNAINSIYGTQPYLGETSSSIMLKSLGGIMQTGASYLNKGGKNALSKQ